MTRLSERHRITDYEAIGRHSGKVLNILQTSAENQVPVDMQDIFGRYTIDAGAEFLFGDHDLNTLDRPLRRPRDQCTDRASQDEAADYGSFANAYALFNLIAVNRMYNPPLVWAARYFFHDTLDGPAKAVTEYFAPLVTREMERKRERLSKSGQEKVEEEQTTFIAHLVASTDGRH